MNRTRTVARFFLAIAAFWLLVAALPVAAQEPAGPQTPAKTPDIVRIPTTPRVPTEQPALDPDEIIRRFSSQEDELARLFVTYGYRKRVRLEEIGADGKPSGEAELTSSSLPVSDDARRKTGGEPQSTLKFLNLNRDDMEGFSKIPTFPFVSSNLPKYELTYEGKQLLDELNTYVFQVKPRQLERTHAYFDGLIWVDDHDLAIVKTYGKWVTETGDVRPSQLPFTIFETYCQPVENKYWFPAYSRSDSSYDSQGVTVPVRLVIRWDQFTPIPPDKRSQQNQPEASPQH